MESTVVDALSGISSVVGVPATVGLCWVYFRFRNTESRVAQLENEVEKLKKARDDDRKETDMKLNAIFDRPNLLLADVSFIKGRFSENK